MLSSLDPDQGQIDIRLFSKLFEDEDTQILESPLDKWNGEMSFGGAACAFDVNFHRND